MTDLPPSIQPFLEHLPRADRAAHERTNARIACLSEVGNAMGVRFFLCVAGIIAS